MKDSFIHSQICLTKLLSYLYGISVWPPILLMCCKHITKSLMYFYNIYRCGAPCYVLHQWDVFYLQMFWFVCVFSLLFVSYFCLVVTFALLFVCFTWILRLYACLYDLSPTSLLLTYVCAWFNFQYQKEEEVCTLNICLFIVFAV